MNNFSDKYCMYAISFENGQMLLIHIGRPMSFNTVWSTYIFAYPELTVEKTNQKFQTNKISGLQKIPNQNKPVYELRMDGVLSEIPI